MAILQSLLQSQQWAAAAALIWTALRLAGLKDRLEPPLHPQQPQVPAEPPTHLLSLVQDAMRHAEAAEAGLTAELLAAVTPHAYEMKQALVRAVSTVGLALARRRHCLAGCTACHVGCACALRTCAVHLTTCALPPTSCRPPPCAACWSASSGQRQRS